MLSPCGVAVGLPGTLTSGTTQAEFAAELQSKSWQ
jgi:hypothetical protein